MPGMQIPRRLTEVFGEGVAFPVQPLALPFQLGDLQPGQGSGLVRHKGLIRPFILVAIDLSLCRILTMKNMIVAGLGAATGLLLTALSAAAKGEDAVPDHKLSEFKLGDHVSGSEVDLSKQDGKVVVIEYWGTR